MVKSSKKYTFEFDKLFQKQVIDYKRNDETKNSDDMKQFRTENI